MSADDDAFVERLLEDARSVVPANELDRQARICEGVLRAGGGGGGGGTTSGRAAPWWRGGWAALGIGAALISATGLAFMRSPPRKASDAPRGEPTVVASATTSAASVEAAAAGPMVIEPAGRSVWELPSAAEPAVRSRANTTNETAGDFEHELAALVVVRKKLREGDASTAIVLLDDFDRRFPRARTRDEAVVLRVEALFALGRDDDARRVGNGFVARHPDSIYRPRVVQLLGGSR